MASWSSSGMNSKEDDLLFAAFICDNQQLKQLAHELDNGEGVAKVLTRVSTKDGKRALDLAVVGDPIEIRMSMCKYLVEELNIDVNLQDDQGRAPLHHSTMDGNYVTSAYLLDHGADPNLATYKDVTPLQLAVDKGQKDLLGLLISKGAKVDTVGPVGTALHVAAKVGKKDNVEFLLENHANPNLVCYQSLPPLIVAVQGKSVDCVKLMLKWGADPNIASWGLTPLITAVSEGETEMIKCLLSAGANPDARDFYERVPIEIAAIKGNHSDVEALFPVTTPIESIQDWSVRGILKYVNSKEAIIKRNLRREHKFLEAKEKGAVAVKRKHDMEAIHWYTEARSIKPEDAAALLSNTSYCYTCLKLGDEALEDAMDCIKLRKDWPKAHYRAGMALMLLQDYKRAAEEFKIALKLEPKNKELQEAHREAELKYQASKINSVAKAYEDHDEAYDGSQSYTRKYVSCSDTSWTEVGVYIA